MVVNIHNKYISIIVNLNSKYKEDDYTDSSASGNSLDVCVHRIHFRNEASTPHMSNPFYLDLFYFIILTFKCQQLYPSLSDQ